MKGYLDNTLVSAVGKQEHQSDLIALNRLFALRDAGVVSLVTSEVTHREIQRYSGSNRPGIENVYDALEKVPLVEANELVGINSHWDRHGGWNSPVFEDDPIWLELLGLNLEPTDAHHVMVAVRSRCDAFLTVDQRTILRRRANVEARFQIRLQTPSEFLASVPQP
jgi:predicted nucleic acid-binding protein